METKLDLQEASHRSTISQDQVVDVFSAVPVGPDWPLIPVRILSGPRVRVLEPGAWRDPSLPPPPSLALHALALASALTALSLRITPVRP